MSFLLFGPKILSTRQKNLRSGLCVLANSSAQHEVSILPVRCRARDQWWSCWICGWLILLVHYSGQIHPPSRPVLKIENSEEKNSMGSYICIHNKIRSILYYTILYYTILYYTILYYTILYYTILYYTILYYTILYYTILYYTILYYTILYYTILYYTYIHNILKLLKFQEYCSNSTRICLGNNHDIRW